MPSVITSVDNPTKTHGEESKDWKVKEAKQNKPTQNPVPNTMTSPTLKQHFWHFQLWNHNDILSLPKTAWTVSSLQWLFFQYHNMCSRQTSEVAKKHPLVNVNWLSSTSPRVVGHYFLMTFQGDKKVLIGLFSWVPVRDLFFLGSSWQTNLIIFIPLKVDIAFLFQEIYVHFC